MKLTRTVQYIIASIVFINIFVLAYLWTLPSELPANKAKAVQCDFTQGACINAFNLDGQPIQITLTLTPGQLPITKPLEAEVNVNGYPFSTGEIDISGVNMYMGFNRQPLEKVSAGTLRGETMLAFCTENKMIWKATVILKQDKESLEVPFEFETIRN